MLNKIAEPLAYIMRWLYSLTANYAVALFLFAITITIICLPLTIISRKNSIIKAKMAPELSAIAKKFAKPKDAPVASPDKTLEEREAILAADRERQKQQNQAIAKVYEKHKYKPYNNWISICVRYFFIIAVFSVVTSPLTHLCSLPKEIVTAVTNTAVNYTETENVSQLQAFEIMRQNFSDFKSKVPDLTSYYSNEEELPNLSLFNGTVNMAKLPSLKSPDNLLLFPIAIYIVGFIQSLVPLVINNIKTKKHGNAKKEKGIIIGEIISLFISPILLTYFAFKVPPMLCVYYFSTTIINTVLGVILAFAMPIPEVKSIDNEETNVAFNEKREKPEK